MTELLDAGLVSPVRLGLTPLGGAVDRVARDINCCWRPLKGDTREVGFGADYFFAGPVAVTVAEGKEVGASAVRFNSGFADRRTYGVRVTTAERASVVSWKLANMRHTWDQRVLSERHR